MAKDARIVNDYATLVRQARKTQKAQGWFRLEKIDTDCELRT